MTHPNPSSSLSSSSFAIKADPKPRRLHAHETPSQLAKTGYDAHAQTYLAWTLSTPNPSRLHYLQRVLDLLSSRPQDNLSTSTSSQIVSKSPAASSAQPRPAEGGAEGGVGGGVGGGGGGGGGGGAVLELGCGAGVPVTLYLARETDAVRHVVATDISSTQLELLRKGLRERECALERERGDGDDDDHEIMQNEKEKETEEKKMMMERVEVIESDMLDLAFEERKFDAVVAFFSLIHLARGDQVVMVKRIWSWLREGGYLCANFGIADGEDAEDELQGQEVGCKETSTIKTGSVLEGWLGMNAYWDGWGVERTRAILKDVGFDIIVADVVEEVGDANFLWIIARKLDVS